MQIKIIDYDDFSIIVFFFSSTHRNFSGRYTKFLSKCPVIRQENRTDEEIVVIDPKRNPKIKCLKKRMKIQSHF